MKKQLQHLKKGDVFIFEGTRFTVREKFREGDYVLVTECGHLFLYDKLEVEVENKKQ